MPPGSTTVGGAMATVSGLVFVAGKLDRRIHVLDVSTGENLWSGELPASAPDLPMTYRADGRQFLVIAAGGAVKVEGQGQSDAVVAFTLP